MKGILRIVEKLAFEHEPRKLKDVRYLVDVARNEVLAGTLSALMLVLSEILLMHNSGIIRIVRFKNRFAHPTPGGWADLVLNAVSKRALQ